MRNEQQALRLAILRSATAQRVGTKQIYATMRKSALIATCLTNSAMVPDVNAGEAAVRQVFAKRTSRASALRTGTAWSSVPSRQQSSMAWGVLREFT